jgi:hypothetical protein
LEDEMEAYYRNPKLYFIGGKAQSGKTTLGELLKQEYEKEGKKVAVLYHSKYIKEYAKEHFGWDGKEETKPRELLQQLGTEIIRDKLNKKYFHVNRITEDIEILSYLFDVIIVNDVRFKIEIDIPREKFGDMVAIKIIRENFDNNLTDKQKQHPTEVDLDDYGKFDYVIVNNGTINDLRANVREIMGIERDVKI